MNCGGLPPLSAERGQLAMHSSEIYPEYRTGPNILISPAYLDRYDLQHRAKTEPTSVLRDHSYWYLGFAVRSEEEILAFVSAVRDAAEAGETLTEDIEPADVEHGEIFRLREGIERFFITDIHNPKDALATAATIPVMIERPGMHAIGANVLYLDGHLEFLRYPSHFPMTEAIIKALKSLDELK